MKIKKTVLTSKGKDLMTYALNGHGVQFTQMVLSSQSISDEEVENLTTLNAQMSEIVQDVEKFDNDTVILKSTYTNEILDYSFYVSAIGVYAKTDVTSEILFGVALTYPDNKDYMPSRYENEFTMYVDMFLSIGNAQTILVEDSTSKKQQEQYIASLMDKSVTSLQFPSYLTSLGPYAFAYCNNLTDVDLPQQITELPESIFMGCSNLQRVSFSDSITSITDNAFKDCMELIEVSLNDNIDTFWNNAFQNCRKLRIEKLPTELMTIGSKSLYRCESIEGELIIPVKVAQLDDNCLSYCYHLDKVVFKGTPGYIASTAFTGCENLREIYVPWNEGEVAYAPWGAINATIVYYWKGE